MDFGCGTGVLSIFASRAGAEKVYAVDQSIFIQQAHAIAKCNNIRNIFFYHNDHKDLKLDTKVDLLVSEWMGHFLFHEEMLGPLLNLRDKYLVEGGTMIPGKISLHAGLVTDDFVYKDSAFLKQTPYGIDFSPIADAPLCETLLETVTPQQIMDTTIDLGTFDLHTLEAPPEELKGTVVPTVKATVYGFCGWFNAHLVDGINLGTGPNDPPTHWNQLYFSFNEPLEVEPGVELTIHITLPRPDNNHEPAWYWSISDGTRTIEMNDIDHREQLDPFLSRGLIE
jgi:SAM-dependent methyltransferase